MYTSSRWYPTTFFLIQAITYAPLQIPVPSKNKHNRSKIYVTGLFKKAIGKADATNAAFSAASADYDAAMQKQGEGGKPQPIRRDEPKVNRNDPCPCGSGKKYKRCCGKTT